jgi:pimeloyl-ACP methyl ester carboxylesterase
LAAKSWGPSDGRPVICLHGWQENAAAFDRVIPHLSSKLNLNLVAVDMAGCGHSSHYPPGFAYYEHDVLMLVKRVKHYFGWDKFSLLGHSLGGGLLQLYAGTFPDEVESLAVIDLVRPVYRAVETYPVRLRKSVTEYINWEILTTDKEVIAPVYSWEEARRRLIGAAKSLTPESADVLLSRGLKPAITPDGKEGYVYRRDPRLKVSSLVNLTSDQVLTFLKNITCPMMIIKGTQGPKYEGEKVHEEMKKWFAETLKDFQYVEVEGNHHIHLNNPEAVASHLNKFYENIYESNNLSSKL